MKIHCPIFRPRTAALLALFFTLNAPAAAPLIDFGGIAPEKVRLHTAEKRGQSVRTGSGEEQNMLRIDWDNSRSSFFEFTTSPGTPLPPFRDAKIRVQVYIPESCKAKNLNLRISDKDGEVFQFTHILAAGEPGRREIVYEIDAEKPGAGSWGAGKKVNKRIDFPAQLTGFAADFNSKTGTGHLGIGAAGIELLRSDRVLQPTLETGNPVRVLTPGRNAAVALRNPFTMPVSGRLAVKLTDAFGAPVGQLNVETSLAPGEQKLFELPTPEKFGVYYADVDYREPESGGEPFEKRFSFSYMRPAGPTSGPARGFLFGVCSHPQGASVADQEKEALAAALCGVKIMRTDMYWEYIQPTPDRWNFQRFDTTLDIFGKQNIEVQAIYCYLPKWAAAKDWKPLSSERKGRPRPDYDAWRVFIRTAAQHYRGKLRYVEVWNEPDHIGFANFSAAEYIELMKIAYAETKKAAPEMTVLTGGYTSMPGPFSRRMEPNHMFKTLTEGKGFYDVLAFHGHGSFFGYRNQIEQLVKMRGEWKVTAPWYANETAISSINIGELAQAVTLYQKFLYSWARGSIGYNWYDLRNDGLNPKENEHNFGLITKDFHPKAAYGVYNMLASVFHNAEYLRDADAGSDATGFFFRSADGDLLFPHWLESGGSDRILLLSGVAGPVTRIDLFGNEQELPLRNGCVLLETGTTPATLRFRNQKEFPGIHGEFLRPADDFNFRPGRSVQCRLELKNPTAEPLTFRIDAKLPEGLTLRKAPGSVKIAPGKTETVTLEIDAADQFRSFHGRQKSIGLEVSADRFWNGTIRIPVYSVTALAKQLRALPDFTLDRPEQLTSLAPNNPESAHLFWKGPEDLSAEVRLGRDDDNLLLRVEVRDDVHSQPYREAGTWAGDNVQVALKLPGQKGMWEIGLTRLAGGENEVYLWFAPDKFDARKVAAAIELSTERDENARITGYTARIPFSAIGFDTAAARNGFRFNLLVNDNDGEMRESFLSVAPGIGLNKTPETYPVVVFEP